MTVRVYIPSPGGGYVTKDVPEEEVASYIAKGAGVEKGAYTMVSPDGKTGTLDSAELGSALSHGFRFETTTERQERIYGDSDVRAFLEGTARGATLGLSDVAMEALGVDSEGLAGRRGGNPYAAGAGELAGAVGSLFLPGGQVSGAGKLATAGKVLRGVSLPARATVAAGMATEAKVSSALLKYLTTKGIPKEAMKAAQLMERGTLAQRALAKSVSFSASGAVEGSLYGLGQGITEYTLGDPVDTADMFMAHIGGGMMMGAAVGGVFGAGGELGGRVLRKFTEVAEGKLGTEVKIAERAEMLEPLNKLGVGSYAKRKKLWDVEATSKTLKADDILPDGPIIRKGDDFATSMTRLADALETHGSALGTIRARADEAMDIAGKALDGPDMNVVARKINQLIEELEGRLPSQSEGIRRELDKLRNDFLSEGVVGFQRAQDLLETFSDSLAKTPGLPKANIKAHRAVYKWIREEIDSKITKYISPEDAAIYAKSRKIYRNLITLKETATEPGAKEFIGKVISSVAGGVAWRLAYGQGLKSALGMGLASGVMGAGVRHVFRQKGLVNKAAKLRYMHEKFQQWNANMDIMASAFINPKSERAKTTAIKLLTQITGEKDSEKAAKKLAVDVQKWANDPEMFANQVAASLEGFEEVAPEMAQLMAAQMAAIHQTLVQSMPRRPATNHLQPLRSEDWKMTKRQVNGVATTALGLLSPVEAIRQAMNGKPNTAALNLVVQHYPKFSQEMANKILFQVALSKKPLTWTQKSVLSKLLGMPVDKALTGQYLLRSAMVHMARQQQGGPRPGAQPNSEALSKLDEVPNLFETQSQASSVIRSRGSQ